MGTHTEYMVLKGQFVEIEQKMENMGTELEAII
jgi:hypothetical protein